MFTFYIFILPIKCKINFRQFTFQYSLSNITRYIFFAIFSVVINKIYEIRISRLKNKIFQKFLINSLKSGQFKFKNLVVGGTWMFKFVFCNIFQIYVKYTWHIKQNFLGIGLTIAWLQTSLSNEIWAHGCAWIWLVARVITQQPVEYKHCHIWTQ